MKIDLHKITGYFLLIYCFYWMINTILRPDFDNQLKAISTIVYLLFFGFTYLYFIKQWFFTGNNEST